MTIALARDKRLRAGRRSAAADEVALMFVARAVGPRLAIAAHMTIEIVVGRWLAWSVHPRAAWGRLGPGGRAALLGTYFAAGYVATLAMLVAA